jgi:hypothetical protein
VGLCDVHRIPWQGHDILKTSNWTADTITEEDYLESLRPQGHEPHPLYLQSIERRRKALGVEPHPGLWTRRGVNRLLHFSMRLQELLKRAGLKGLKNELGESRPLTPEEKAWVEEKLQLLAVKKLVELEEKKPAPSARKMSPALARWFAAYLRKNASASPRRYNFGAIEKKHAVTLPSTYKEFISQVGEKEYVDVDGIDGFTARILAPTKFNFKSYRRGKLDAEELAELDCVLFAVTGHGDGFCFDVASPGPDYPVYHYQHELGMMELYARNFAECIKRFSA